MKNYSNTTAIASIIMALILFIIFTFHLDKYLGDNFFPIVIGIIIVVMIIISFRQTSKKMRKK